MKKIIALIFSLAAVMSLASCGGETENTSSATSLEVSSTAPIQPVISIVPPVVSAVEEEEETAPNLALADGSTVIDMNTGKAEGDDGYKAYYGGTHTPDLAVNGNTADGWQPNDKPDGTGDLWLGVEFAEATVVDMVVLYWEKGSVPDAYGTGFKVEYTADGTTWVEAANAEVARTDADPMVDAVSFDATEVKAVRVVILKESSEKGNWTPKLWEFEVYAPAAEEGETSDEAASEAVSEEVSETTAE